MAGGIESPSGERRAARQREYYQTHREERAEYHKKYVAAHSHKVKKQQKRYYEAHRESRLESSRKRYQAQKDAKKRQEKLGAWRVHQEKVQEAEDQKQRIARLVERTRLTAREGFNG